MIARVAHLCRHPIKSIGFEEVGSAELAPARAFPFDREWAVAHEAAAFEGAPDTWQPKRNFLRGAAAEGLMAVSCTSDPAARRVWLRHPVAGEITVAPDDGADGARLIAWLAPLWPANRPMPRRVVAAPGVALTDVPEPWVAVLNLASNRALGQRLGQSLSIHRWRGNIWIDGLDPWAEFDLVGRRLRLGDAVLEVMEPITRCQATMANPETGSRDADTLGALEAGYGHQDFGVYARVVEGGTVALGAGVEVE